ncbi:MAG: CBS domain-containing protein [Bacteroidales bacterium]
MNVLNIKDIISIDFPTVRENDKGENALSIMDDMRVSQIPVLSTDNKLIALISEKEIYDFPAISKPLKLILNKNFPYIKNNEHPIVIANTFAYNGCSVLPVVDSDTKLYCGAITLKEFALAFFRDLNSASVNAVIAVEINQNDYMLSQLSHIIEQNNGRITKLFFNKKENNNNSTELVLYIDAPELRPILNSLERFGYNASNILGNDTDEDNMVDDYYKNLVSYLNV